MIDRQGTSLAQPPFEIPPAPKPITSAARADLSGKAPREDWYAQSPQGEPYGSYMLDEVGA